MENFTVNRQEATIKPEHPRPDWQRSEWLNLNGYWEFCFDKNDMGMEERWFSEGNHSFKETITVPFSWSSVVSGIGQDEKGIGWYARTIDWEPAEKETCIFLSFGAVDYRCEVWLNGSSVGSHTGGYSSFEFDVTDVWNHKGPNRLVVRVEDQDELYQTRGKQGYGEIRGIWQTVWLETRSKNYIQSARFRTRIDGTVEVSGVVYANQQAFSTLRFQFDHETIPHDYELALSPGENYFQTSFKIEAPRLWSPESPNLYEGTIDLQSQGINCVDTVSTYFGIREIKAEKYGDRNYKWIMLNGKPIFLSGTLDQSFHPESHFTFPSDEYIRDEIWRLKRLGLNFVRIHIKPEEPRKLYWADKLGMLVMEDMPCFWGEPDEKARAAYELEAKEIINRDFNHPSIISWVVFNETWGLFSKDKNGENVYLPETKEWVLKIYEWAKAEDPTRLIEDNSACNYDHVKTDLNTWHFYLNGYETVREHIQNAVDKTYPGSSWNFTDGFVQSDAPLMNSECGAVWGIDGSAGDSDLAWHYRYMVNEFRRHDKMCGFIFTEFHDVINEFNGYYRMDRQEKSFGYDWFSEGMSLRDLHSPDFIVIEAPPCRTHKSSSKVQIPLLASSYSDQFHGKSVKLSWKLWHDSLGKRQETATGEQKFEWKGYGVWPLQALEIAMPDCDAVAVLEVTLTTFEGQKITSNFITFDVQSGNPNGRYAIDGNWMNIKPINYNSNQWEYTWNALSDNKLNGATSGYVEYVVELPAHTNQAVIQDLDIFFEASAKIVLAKDKEMVMVKPNDITYMHGAKMDPGMNINSYFMSDEDYYPSLVDVFIDEEKIQQLWLPDDPADSRGVLSWHYQENHRKLEEAGSYGFLQRVRVPSRMVARIFEKGLFTLRLSVSKEVSEKSGGLALYGRNAGRYPIDILVRWK
jgi:hypothetical protein